MCWPELAHAGLLRNNSLYLLYTMIVTHNAVLRGASSTSFKRFASTKVSIFSLISCLLLIQVQSLRETLKEIVPAKREQLKGLVSPVIGSYTRIK